MRHPYYGEMVTRNTAEAGWLIRNRVCLRTVEDQIRDGRSDEDMLADPRFGSLRPQELAVIRYRLARAARTAPGPGDAARERDASPDRSSSHPHAEAVNVSAA